MWYLVTEPHTSEKHYHTYNEFGYLSMFNGVGIYVFDYQNRWYMTVYEDLGVTEINYQRMAQERVEKIN